VKVLVLGGTRFIGRAIVARLLREGHQVTLLNRGLSPDPFGTRVRRVVGDRRKVETLDSAVRKGEYDVVVDINSYHESETASVIEKFKDHIGHLIHVSTAAVYLIREGLFPPFRESDFHGRLLPKRPGNESSWLYAYHKRRCEEALNRAWEEDRLAFTSLRLPMVVGAHDYTRRADAYLERIMSGGPLLLPGGGLNSWGFLWVEDVAEAVAGNLANSTAFGRAYNLAQRESTTVRQFIELVGHLLERMPQLFSLPTEWLEAVGLGTGFSPYSHDHDVLLDCRAAEEDLLFRPTPILEWAEHLVSDFRSRWNGALEAFAATRPFELLLAGEVSKIRLPSIATADVSNR